MFKKSNTDGERGVMFSDDERAFYSACMDARFHEEQRDMIIGFYAGFNACLNYMKKDTDDGR